MCRLRGWNPGETETINDRTLDRLLRDQLSSRVTSCPILVFKTVIRDT